MRLFIYHIAGLKTKNLIICVLFTLCGLPLTSFAQFGIKAGFSFSNFYFTGDYTPYNEFDVDLRPYMGYDVELVQTQAQSVLISPTLGVYYKFQLSAKFGIRPEFSYLLKGVSFQKYDYERISYRVRIHSLELPISLMFAYLKKEKVSGDLILGVFAAYQLKATKKVTYHENEYSEDIESINKMEYGIHTGINYQRTIADHPLLFELKLFLGLSDVFTIPEDWIPIYIERKNIRNTGINLSIGYEF